MAQSHFSLSWDQHSNNICHGLSGLQQNGEFVDMTLAADGHRVKVHQVIIALASPYLKELIASAGCPHPVIFLNKLSYNTLCSILEYIYTGEVLVSIENLNELVDAGRELHITGLQDMKLHKALNQQPQSMEEEYPAHTEVLDESEIEHLDDTASEIFQNVQSNNEIVTIENMLPMDESHEEVIQHEDVIITTDLGVSVKNDNSFNENMSVMQYTVSNQGSLQMILNRFLYYLKHTNRNKTRQWRCVDYINPIKCPAYVITRDNVVLQRILAHTHPFHDKKIMKKLRNASIFSAIQDAETKGVEIIDKKSINTENDQISDQDLQD